MAKSIFENVNNKNAADTCLVCGSETSFYLKGKDFLYNTTKKEFPIYKCVMCLAEQVMPMPKTEELKYFYPPHYYSFKETNNPKTFLQKVREKIIDISYTKNSSKNLLYFFAIIVKPLLHGIPLRHRGTNTFLDVGCGAGHNLRLLSRHGWDVTGFEIGSPLINGNIYYGKALPKVYFTTKKFDYIRVWHVLEHVSDPHAFVSRLASLISEDGIIAIGIPNTRSFYAQLFKKYWYNRDIPRHVINYNACALKLLLKEYGLDICSIKHVSSGGGLGSLQHFLNDLTHGKFDLINNPFLFILFFPLDLICNFFHRGDCLSVEVKKYTSNEKV